MNFMAKKDSVFTLELNAEDGTGYTFAVLKALKDFAPKSIMRDFLNHLERDHKYNYDSADFIEYLTKHGFVEHLPHGRLWTDKFWTEAEFGFVPAGGIKPSRFPPKLLILEELDIAVSVVDGVLMYAPLEDSTTLSVKNFKRWVGELPHCIIAEINIEFRTYFQNSDFSVTSNRRHQNAKVHSQAI